MTQALQNELTPEQVELVAKLKADVAAIVEVRTLFQGVKLCRGESAKDYTLFALNTHMQKDASLKLHCNEHCYVRFLRARYVDLRLFVVLRKF